MSIYRRLLPFLRPYSWRMAGAVAANIGAALLDAFTLALLIPFLNTLFDQPPLTMKAGWVSDLLRTTVGVLLNPADKMGSLRNVILLVLCAVLLKNFLAWIAGRLGASLQEDVTRDLRNVVYHHLARLPLSYFTKTKTGQILSRVIVDTFETRLILTQLVTQGLQAGSLVFASIAFLLGISWKLTISALVVAPLLMVSLQPLLRKLRKGNRRRGNVHGEMTAVLQETMNGIRLVKSYGAELYEESRFTEASNKYAKSTVRLTRLSLLANPLTEILGTTVAITLLWIGARQVLVEHSLSGADLITFLLYVMRMLQPLKQLTQIPATAQSSLAAAERLFEILDEPSEKQNDTGTIESISFNNTLEFKNVSFSYGDGNVLSGINLSAKKGEIIALVGSSGAGKSTMADLIPRFYEPTSGQISIDGVDTKTITLPALRSLIGIVSQDTVIFNDSVKSNIAYGAEVEESFSDSGNGATRVSRQNQKKSSSTSADARSFTQHQIEQAAQAANAHAFITQLPDGYETLLGERGTRLSGGQRQRIAIARALLNDPPILILDEATSALDTESERLVQEAVDRLLEGRTVFVIAHRLSTIMHASQILVLDKGEIVERGTHSELLAKQGPYHKLYTMQFRDTGYNMPTTINETIAR